MGKPSLLLPLLMSVILFADVIISLPSERRRCVPFVECPSGNIVTKELRGPGSTDVCCIFTASSSLDVSNVDVRFGPSEEQRCVPFFECPADNIVTSGVSHICCDFGDVTPPAPKAPASCSTRGTPDGLCVEVGDCITDLKEHLNDLSFAEFVARFGCGRERPGGNVRVCCPKNA